MEPIAELLEFPEEYGKAATKTGPPCALGKALARRGYFT